MEFCLRTAKECYEFLMDDFDDLLTWGEARKNVLPDGTFLDPPDEVLDDLEIYISLKEGKAHLAQGLFNVIFLKDTPASELLENSF
jgi:hypothetical protein